MLYANIPFTEDKKDPHVNDDSVKFHQKLGYELVGRHSQCGYKFGRWYGVCWLEKNLSIRPAIVEPFIPFSKLSSEY